MLISRSVVTDLHFVSQLFSFVCPLAIFILSPHPSSGCHLIHHINFVFYFSSNRFLLIHFPFALQIFVCFSITLYSTTYFFYNFVFLTFIVHLGIQFPTHTSLCMLTALLSFHSLRVGRFHLKVCK